MRRSSVTDAGPTGDAGASSGSLGEHARLARLRRRPGILVAGRACMISANDAAVKGCTYAGMTWKKHVRAQQVA